MKDFYKGIFIALILMTTVDDAAFSYGNTADEPDLKYVKKAVPDAPFTAFPDDTVQTFIKKFGKDSLLHLLDIRINGAGKWLKENAVELSDETVRSELVIVSKKYKLRLDSLYEKSFTDSFLVNGFYGFYYGDTLRYTKVIDNAMSGGFDFRSEVLKSINTVQTRSLLSALCSHFPLDDTIMEAFYKPVAGFSNTAKLNAYFQLASMKNKCAAVSTLNDTYRSELFGELFQKYNIQKILSNKVTDFSEDNASVFILQYPLQLTAYGLLAKDITLAKDGKQLMYLLSTQLKDHSWAIYNMPRAEGDVIPSFYGVWALCEFREQLKSK